MNFLPDVFIPYEICKSKRYNKETLEIFYKERNIADILNTSVDNALVFFDKIPVIKDRLQTLSDVGLGYLTLGH